MARLIPRFLLLVLLTQPLSAQGADRSASRELLDRARAALNDLQYLRADTIAREMLSLSRLPRAARAEALQVLAAANYPDPPAARREAFARAALTQLVQIDLGLTIPPELKSPALDSLYQSVLSTVFAASIFVRAENTVNGVDGSAPIRVRTNRPAIITLMMRSRDGIESVLLDSVSSAQDTTLQLRVTRNNRTLFRGGELELLVTATDVSSRQAIRRSFDIIALVPPLTFLPVPTVVDSSQLRPERGRPERLRLAIGGVLLGAATIGMGQGLRAAAAVRRDTEADRRYVTVGVGIAVLSGVAAWFDRGRTLDKGVEANKRTIGALATRQREAREENARRAREYQATITVNPEWR